MLAPLAGVTDLGLRHLARVYGADLTTTEMVSAKGLLMRGAATRELLATDPIETPVAVQLFGADPFVMKDAVQDPALDKFDIIDVNMGCPVPKVTKTGAGSMLMRTVDRAAAIVRVMSAATTRPVTVKFRLGWDDTSRNYLDFGRAMQDAGAAAVTLHARTRQQGYAGAADWGAIAELRAALAIPVIANGDITDRASYDECRRITGCDAVMIGRGAMGRPWIFDELKGKEPPSDVRGVVETHLALLAEHYGERYAVVNMRHHLGCYLKGIPGAARARGQLNSAPDLASLREVLAQVFGDGRIEDKA